MKKNSNPVQTLKEGVNRLIPVFLDLARFPAIVLRRLVFSLIVFVQKHPKVKYCGQIILQRFPRFYSKLRSFSHARFSRLAGQASASRRNQVVEFAHLTSRASKICLHLEKAMTRSQKEGS